jgi:hypothetical protein
MTKLVLLLGCARFTNSVIEYDDDNVLQDFAEGEILFVCLKLNDVDTWFFTQ